MVEVDELFEISCEVYKIKQHLKKHFELDGDNQPWHLFDHVDFMIGTLACSINHDDFFDLPWTDVTICHECEMIIKRIVNDDGVKI